MGKNRSQDRHDEGHYGEQDQPAVKNLVYRQRKEIKAQGLVKNRVRRRDRELVQEESKLTPVLNHAQSEDETGYDRHATDHRTEESRGIDVDGLIVDDYRSPLEGPRGDGAFDKPEGSAKDDDR